MRHAFVQALTDAARINPKIFLITGDLGFRILESFAEQFPDRFINIGVAEANMVTVAAGLASSGYIPVIYSIATFASMRPFEQIRNDICLQKMNVKIVGIGGGLAYTKAGPTHHSMEDIGLMRLLPGMAIVIPQDPQQTYNATIAALSHDGPLYLRLEKNPQTSVFISGQKFRIGKVYQLKKGTEIALLATGVQVYTAMKVAELLQMTNRRSSVYAFPTVHPIDVHKIQTIAQEHTLVCTLEEHRVNGGFGTAVAECLSDHHLKPDLLRFGLRNEFISYSADYSELIQYNGLTPTQIAQKIREHV